MTHLHHPQSLTHQSLKADILLLNQLIKPDKGPKFDSLSNIYDLHKVLKNKNEKAIQSNYSKQSAKKWIQNLGANLQPLFQNIEIAKKNNLKIQQEINQERQCYFYIENLNYQNINEYTSKANQYLTLNVINKNMRKRDLSKQIHERNMRKMHENYSSLYAENGSTRQIGLPPERHLNMRNKQKAQKYIQCIRDLAKGQFSKSSLVSKIYSVVDTKIWKIFSRHVRCYEQSRNSMISSEKQRLTFIYLESLKLIQEEFDAQLQRSNDSLNHYLQENYIKHLKQKNNNHKLSKQKSLFWGKLFLFYRAGRRTDFFSLLGSQNENLMLGYFNQAQKTIQYGKPEKIDVSQAQLLNSEVFKEQLIYALKGSLRVSDEVLCENSALDLMWVIVRNFGIFYEQNVNEFEESKAKLLSNYQSLRKANNSTSEILFNYLYIFAYDLFALNGQNSVLDQDDLLHFLICLYNYQQFFITKNDARKRLQSALTKSLVSFIRQLIQQDRSEYIYYMSLIPPSYRRQNISELMSSSIKLLTNKYNWEYLAEKATSKAEYEEMVGMTLEKYLQISGNYTLVAEKYIELLNNQSAAIKCLFQLLVKSLRNNSTLSYQHDDIVKKASEQIQRYLQLNSELKNQYLETLQFFNSYNKLESLLLQRKNKESEIFKLISTSKFIVLGKNFSQNFWMLLYNIDNIFPGHGYGLDVYFKYIKRVIKGLQLYYLRSQGKVTQNYQQFLTLLNTSVQTILNREDFKYYKQSEQVRNLKEFMDKYFRYGQYPSASRLY